MRGLQVRVHVVVADIKLLSLTCSTLVSALQKSLQGNDVAHNASKRGGLHVYGGRPSLPGSRVGAAAAHLVQQAPETTQSVTLTANVATACPAIPQVRANPQGGVPEPGDEVVEVSGQQSSHISCTPHGHQQHQTGRLHTLTGAHILRDNHVLYPSAWVSHESVPQDARSGSYTSSNPHPASHGCSTQTDGRAHYTPLAGVPHSQQQHASSAELMSLIKGSTSWQQLAVVLTHGTQLTVPTGATVVHASAALTHLAHLATGRAATRHPQPQSPRQLGMATGSTGTQLGRAGQLADWLVSWVVSQRHQLRARQLSNLSWAVVRLQGAGVLGQEVGAPLLASLCQRADVQWAHFKAQELSSLALAAASGDVAVTDAWVVSLAQAALHRLPEMSAQGHANLLWALARWHDRRKASGAAPINSSIGSLQQGPCYGLVHHTVIRQLLDSVWDVTAPQLPSWPSASLALVSWATSVLQVCGCVLRGEGW
jgi:hypothetical protein